MALRSSCPELHDEIRHGLEQEAANRAGGSASPGRRAFGSADPRDARGFPDDSRKLLPSSCNVIVTPRLRYPPPQDFAK